MDGPAMPIRRRVSLQQKRRLSTQFSTLSWGAPPHGAIYAGLSAVFQDAGVLLLAIAIRDSTYLLDFIQRELALSPNKSSERQVEDFIVTHLSSFSHTHEVKCIGMAIPQHLAERYPRLCSRLWAQMDIIPLVLPTGGKDHADQLKYEFPRSLDWELRSIDEQAESMARKCVRLFGPEIIPLLQVGFLGIVQVDTAFHVQLTRLEDFQATVGPRTWKAVEHYATDLKKRKTKIAFFSATPQGGGVALMRHALVRFSHSLGTDITWYVPKPRPGVFRITKTNHNILQGVSQPEERLTEEKWEQVTDWIEDSAKRSWLRAGGPLTHPSEGGADVIVIDDPQMPALVPIAKKIAPDRPVLFRCHIQIRSDLVATKGTPQEEAWGRLWEYIKQADLFLSHPVKSFVPRTVPSEMVGYMPASTDWLDGLNKNMNDWDTAYYGRIFNATVRNSGMPVIDYPEDEYIVQIARFDPSKGIPDVVASYEKFYDRMKAASPITEPPKLLICGHGSIDDPDGSIIYNAVVTHIESAIPHMADNICIVRLGPCDQVLNAVLSKAKVALQLSTREGFEVKVSEAIHKGIPIIATRAGGIPLQVTDGKNGFLVDVGDTDAVAQHLFELCTNQELYQRMRQYALTHVSDEVSTAGNALNWLYLASKMSKHETLRPNERWIQDMAREEAGLPYTADESRLKRAVELSKMG